MSWHFSRALVEAFSEVTSSDGEPYVLSSGNLTLPAYCSPDRMTAFSRLSRFGMTFEPLTADRGEELLTWFRAAFPAKPTAAHLEGASWRTISGRKCNGSWQMSLPGTYLPRTSKSELLTERPIPLRRWATKSDAWNYQRRTWVQTMCGPDIGYVHTPTVTANYAAPSMQKHPSCRAFVQAFGAPTPEVHEWLMGWPAGWSGLQSLAMDKFRSWRQQHGDCLADADMTSFFPSSALTSPSGPPSVSAMACFGVGAVGNTERGGLR